MTKHESRKHRRSRQEKGEPNQTLHQKNDENIVLRSNRPAHSKHQKRDDENTSDPKLVDQLN